MLVLFATNPGRVLSKRELMDAVWPNVHVGEDNLFQCIREIRSALGDDRREVIRVVSGSGYLFEAEVSAEPATRVAQAAHPALRSATQTGPALVPASSWRRFVRRRRAAVATAGLGCILALAIIMMMLAPGFLMAGRPPSIAVMPVAAGDEDKAMAAIMTTRLADGLAQIDTISVVAPQTSQQADFIVTGELRKTERSWEAQARMTRTATGEIVWTAPVSVVIDEADLALQQSRLVAGVGYPLAMRINALVNADPRPATPEGRPSAGGAKVVIEQATASIIHTSRERFATSQAMLEKALAEDPDNVDLAIALAALQMRGVQMIWYDPTESAAAEAHAGSILKRALRIKPTSIPVLDASCRLLSATNEFTESLVVCARALALNPWHAPALTHIGIAQLQAGRFEEALSSFKRADSYDTPQVSRWTWKLNVGRTYLLMGRSEDALPWLKKSIAITPATGRSHMLLSAAYIGLGRPAEARAAMDQGMALRPGSNLGNVLLPIKNASPVLLAAAALLAKALLAAGLPEY
ncbi:winged helix-turn-helix domain-containing protein [Bosea sp. 685]|uniref:winged helix-turn-helix domain-containing protein n=1 Tax=Bosea sp. 685 TaxID=3080057 RepID=UPI0028936509|nr:winged helix-turn-helix domain-containing protein [Bosea sp. 685]WNJ88100.1 winged helix-turn-helix domain-containing protein [Bosea sp. 685]